MTSVPEDPSGPADGLEELQQFLADEDQVLASLDALLDQLRDEARAHPVAAPDRSAIWGRIRAQVAPPAS